MQLPVILNDLWIAFCLLVDNKPSPRTEWRSLPVGGSSRLVGYTEVIQKRVWEEAIGVKRISDKPLESLTNDNVLYRHRTSIVRPTAHVRGCRLFAHVVSVDRFGRPGAKLPISGLLARMFLREGANFRRAVIRRNLIRTFVTGQITRSL